ncbi:hypothetical protein [Streptomyces sp. 1331.2]|uniref:hypothetical protein n=1 Tax=Streptomyces sp. 1331.2 TaxID=1938835 RepID=UPI000BC3EC8B|nr:hypothetical protein [Streptomyces sp. 1331.2]SOB88416.1 hypothetical protein SAMN06272789_6697 [Streptomyces sp. 1331.2]
MGMDIGIGRKARIGLAVTFGAAAMLALGANPAFAQEGNFTVGSGSCVAIEEIQLQSTSTGLHDFMENNPIQASATDPYWCRFSLIDNGTEVWHSTGAGSGWWADGPGHNMQACVERWYNGTRLSHTCGPIN